MGNLFSILSSAIVKNKVNVKRLCYKSQARPTFKGFRNRYVELELSLGAGIEGKRIFLGSFEVDLYFGCGTERSFTALFSSELLQALPLWLGPL